MDVNDVGVDVGVTELLLAVVMAVVMAQQEHRAVALTSRFPANLGSQTAGGTSIVPKSAWHPRRTSCLAVFGP